MQFGVKTKKPLPINPSLSYIPQTYEILNLLFSHLTGQTRAWHECYDHSHDVIRVHPKQINGQEIISPHYPPTGEEIRW